MRTRTHFRFEKIMPRYWYPAAVVFDLDYTLWPWWCDYHVDPPLTRVSDEVVVDASGFNMSLFPDVMSIIRELKENDVKIIAASRTPTPRIAQEVLSLFMIDGKPLKDFFDSLQWGEGTKIKHITRAIEELGLSRDLRAGGVILFDDEARNRDVESINCNFAYISDYQKGLTRKIFEDALKEWSDKNN